MVDQRVPCIAGGVNDCGVVLEHLVGEVVGSQVLPDVLDRVQLGRFGWQQDYGEVFGHDQFSGAVPSSTIHQDNGAGVAGDVFADLVEMQLHGFGIGARQDEGGTFATLRADGTEQIGVVIALVGGQPRPSSLPRPDASLAVLLANSRFILEPYLDGCALWQVRYVGCEGIGEVFLKASIT